MGLFKNKGTHIRFLWVAFCIMEMIFAQQRYFVLFHENATIDQEKVVPVHSINASISIIHIWDTFKGFSAFMNTSTAHLLTRHPCIDLVEADQTWTLQERQWLPRNWGLGRISWGHPPTFMLYLYPDSAGDGVDVYVLDTGCLSTHPEFHSDRIRLGPSFTGGLVAQDIDEEQPDPIGHGTHVAGIIGGRFSGVAKKANIICVQVINQLGMGFTTPVLHGIQYAVQEAKRTHRKSVINLSTSSEESEVIDRAVASAVESGVTVVVAAGNRHSDACAYSPARSEAAITVGASDKWDRRANFSNYGPCVNIFAPGVKIRSAWNDGDYKVADGTSMATAFVSGVAALYLAEGLSTPYQVRTRLQQLGTHDVIKDVNNSTNLLVHT